MAHVHQYMTIHTIRDFALEKQVSSYKTQPLQSTHFHTNNLPTGRVAVLQLAMPIAKIICMHKINGSFE